MTIRSSVLMVTVMAMALAAAPVVIESEFDGLRAHQVRLEGGDASSDSYCYSEP